jgi:hypothetical protein
MAKKKVYLKTGAVEASIGITGKRISLQINIPESVRKRLFRQLSKFEKD